jgi:NAD(P)H-nitrite reductase large subunit
VLDVFNTDIDNESNEEINCNINNMTNDKHNTITSNLNASFEDVREFNNEKDWCLHVKTKFENMFKSHIVKMIASRESIKYLDEQFSELEKNVDSRMIKKNA